jgi:hypothetical protein
MHYAFAVLDDVDAVERNVEQPARLDRLEAFVEQGSAVDRHLRAHAPRRVVQRLRGRHLRQLLEVVVTEGAA